MATLVAPFSLVKHLAKTKRRTLADAALTFNVQPS